MVVDLTHSIFPEMPVYPGTASPVFRTGCSIDRDGFAEKQISFFTHTGTHVDAPAHLIPGAKTLERFPIEYFRGPGLRLRLPKPETGVVTVKDLQPHEARIRDVAFLLMETGWSRYWGKVEYFSNFPVLSTESARWLSAFGLRGVGLDTVSADTMDTASFPVHRILLGRDILIIENLAHLDHLPSDAVDFFCLPLKIQDADGAPVRAVAFC